MAVSSQALGRQSIKFEKPVFIRESASVVGKKEGEGPKGELFDICLKDDKNGCDTWEDAESSLQKTAVECVMKNPE